MAEFRSVAERLAARAREKLNALQDRAVEFEQSGGVERLKEKLPPGVRERASRMADRLQAFEDKIAQGKHPLNPEYQATVRLWYQRLELEPGSDATRVRSAYRAMMRKYHPDRYGHDRASEEMATRVSQELTVAHDGLLEYLGES